MAWDWGQFMGKSSVETVKKSCADIWSITWAKFLESDGTSYVNVKWKRVQKWVSDHIEKCSTRLPGQVYLGFSAFLNPNWVDRSGSIGKVNVCHPENVWSNSTDTTKHILVKLIKAIRFQLDLWSLTCCLNCAHLLPGPDWHDQIVSRS